MVCAMMSWGLGRRYGVTSRDAVDERGGRESIGKKRKKGERGSRETKTRGEK